MKIRSSSRINFGIDYYDDEEETNRVGQAYEGGTKWGLPFGRDEAWDLHDDLRIKDGVEIHHPHLYAVIVP